MLSPRSPRGAAPKDDLPIPESWFAWGASIVLIVSFVGALGRVAQAALRGGSLAPFERLSRLLMDPATEVLAGRSASFCSA